MTLPMIVEAKVTGEEIERIISDKLFPAVEDEERAASIISMLTLVLTLMKPEISPKEIQDGVRGVSEWMCLFLSDTVTEEDAPDHEKRLKDVLN